MRFGELGKRGKVPGCMLVRVLSGIGGREDGLLRVREGLGEKRGVSDDEGSEREQAAVELHLHLHGSDRTGSEELSSHGYYVLRCFKRWMD